jgi:hypothetical protein
LQPRAGGTHGNRVITIEIGNGLAIDGRDDIAALKAAGFRGGARYDLGDTHACFSLFIGVVELGA